MTVSEAGGPAKRRRGGLGFKILIGVAIALALLWTGGWFAIRHYVAGKIDAVVARAEAEGASLSCGAQSLSGFPFRLAVTCTPIEAACPAEDASLSLAGVEAMGLVYNPGHMLFDAKGPMTMTGPDGITASANWSALQSSLRVGFSGLKRYSIVSDGLDASLTAPSRLTGPVAFKADHAELHLVPDPDTAGMIDVFTTVENGVTTLPGRPAVPPATSNVAIGVPEAVLKERNDPVAAWIASGQPVRIHRAEIDVAGFALALAGDATIDAAGLISGTFTVRLSALDALPALVDRFRPGSGEKVARLIGPISAFLRPVDADGKTWREAKITVQRGRVVLGFIPLGQIPSLLRGQGGIALAPAPAQPDQSLTSAANTAPAAPQDLGAPAAAVPAAEAPAAPLAPSPAATGAAAAIRDLATTLKHPGRCARS